VLGEAQVAKKLKRKMHKGLAKRVKVTATGKVLHRRGGKSHLLSKKSSKHRRRLSAPGEFKGGQATIVRRLLALE
jgi:large subunit ribosomal protein L35